MARDYAILNSPHPAAIAPASIHIAHVQLRDLIICPRERGIVNYVRSGAIIEQNLQQKDAPTRKLAELSFSPNSLTHLPTGPNGNDTLLAAGGQDAEIHLSYHTPSSSRSKTTRRAWDFERKLTGSINNSVLLTSLSLSESHESSVEPRVGISNNDCTFKLHDIPLRVHNNRRELIEVGQVRFDVPINHSSISPDGRTLLSVGDSNRIYFHCISGSSSRVTFSPVTTLTLPPPDFPSDFPYWSPGSSLAASFSTAFSGDGSKFAVASQEGVVAVWDVRSTRPLKVFQTDKNKVFGSSRQGNGSATGWLSDDPWEWTRGNKAPGWCVRSVKFNGGSGARLGREVMAFTEHSNLIHVVDARTFEKDEVIRIPTIHRPSSSRANASSSGSYRPSGSARTRPRRVPQDLTHPNSSAASTITTTPNSVGAGSSPTSSSSSRSNPSSNTASSHTRTVRGTLNRRPAQLTTASSATPAFPRFSLAGAGSQSGNPIRRHRGPDPSNSSPAGTRPGMSRASSDVLQALSDTFRIDLPSSTATSSAASGHSRSVSDSAALPVLTSTSSMRSTSSPVGRTAYSPPASIGDSTWRTLGGAWPARSTSAPQNPTDAASSASAPSAPTSSNSTAASSTPTSTTQTTGSRSSSTPDPSNILFIPRFGDFQVESDVRTLLEALGVASRYSPESTSSSSSGNQQAVAGSTDWDALLEVLRGNIPPSSASASASSPGASGSINSAAATSNTQQQSGWSSWGRDHDLRDQYEVADMVRPGEEEEEEDSRGGSSSGQNYIGDGVPWVMMDVDEDGPGRGQSMDADAEGDLDGDYDLDLDLDRELDGDADVDMEAERDRDEDEDDESEDEDEEEGDEGRLGRRVRRRTNTGSETPSSCSSADNSRSSSPVRILPPPLSTSPSARRYGVLGGSSSSPGVRMSAGGYYVPQTISPTDTPTRRSSTIHLDGFTPLSLPLFPPAISSSSACPHSSLVSSYSAYPASSGSKPTSKPKTYHIGKNCLYGYHDDLDIAGLCFDPTGERMYVANCTPVTRENNGFGGYGPDYGSPGSSPGVYGVNGEIKSRVGAIVEWEVRGADKRWWVDDGWR